MARIRTLLGCMVIALVIVTSSATQTFGQASNSDQPPHCRAADDANQRSRENP